MPVLQLLSLCLILLSFINVPCQAQTTSVGFLGDSISTGGATHAQLQFDAKALGKVFQGEAYAKPDPTIIQAFNAAGYPVHVDDPRPPLLMPSRREFHGGLDWVFRHVSRRFADFYLDTPLYAWSVLTARRQSVPYESIFLAAEDGARIEVLARQVDRLLDARQTVLPDDIFIFFTGNDLCGQTMAQVTSAEDYGRRLYDGLVYMIRNGRPGPRGTKVWVLHPLSILQLVQSEAILNKTIYAHGQEMTCKALHRSHGPAQDNNDWQSFQPETAFVMQLLPRRPSDYCPTLFTKDLSGTLANRVRSYRDQADQAIQRFNKMLADAGKPNLIQVRAITSTANVVFEAQDIANDCFHLSPFGHLKIAQAVQQEMGNSSSH